MFVARLSNAKKREKNISRYVREKLWYFLDFLASDFVRYLKIYITLTKKFLTPYSCNSHKPNLQG